MLLHGRWRRPEIHGAGDANWTTKDAVCRERKLPFFGQQPISFYPFTPCTSPGVKSVGDVENEALARQLGEEISNRPRG